MIVPSFSKTFQLLLLISLVCVSLSEFTRPQQSIQRHLIQLRRASDIPHEGLAYNFSQAVLPVFSLSLDVDFGSTLSQEQFENLKSTYSGWSASKSQVQYKSGVRYTLIDFLPPLLQATSSLRFKAQERVYGLPDFKYGSEKPVADQKCQFLLNCWGFAYNVLYSSRTETDRIHFALSSPTVAFSIFLNSTLFRKIQHTKGFSEGGELFKEALLRNSNLQPGDAVLIWHQNKGDIPYLDHIAIYIDDDLYFEKAGTGDDVPFRLNDWEGLTKSWIPGVFNFDWIRLQENARPEHPLDAFALDNPISLKEVSSQLQLLVPEVKHAFSVTPSLGNDGHLDGQTYIWMKSLEPFVIDSMGRAGLPQSAFDPKALEVEIPKNIYTQHILLQKLFESRTKRQ